MQQQTNNKLYYSTNLEGEKYLPTSSAIVILGGQLEQDVWCQIQEITL